MAEQRKGEVNEKDQLLSDDDVEELDRRVCDQVRDEKDQKVIGDGGVTVGTSGADAHALIREAIDSVDFLRSDLGYNENAEDGLEFGPDTCKLDYFAVRSLSPSYEGEDRGGIGGGGGGGTRRAVLEKTLNLQPGSEAAAAACKKSVFRERLQWWKKKVSTEVDRPVE